MECLTSFLYVQVIDKHSDDWVTRWVLLAVFTPIALIILLLLIYGVRLYVQKDTEPQEEELLLPLGRPGMYFLIHYKPQNAYERS